MARPGAFQMRRQPAHYCCKLRRYHESHGCWTVQLSADEVCSGGRGCCALPGNLMVAPLSTAAPDTTLLAADFNTGVDGFTYADDLSAPASPSTPSGSRATSGGYGGTGGLQVTLGGVDANAITGMSGGWSYTLNLAAAESGRGALLPLQVGPDRHLRIRRVQPGAGQGGRCPIRPRRQELRGPRRRRWLQHAGQQQQLLADHRLAAGTRSTWATCRPAATPSSWAATTTRRTPPTNRPPW